MKYFKLVRRNLFRNKTRAFLTLILMAVIFFFVGTLLSILESFDRYGNQGAGANRLVVESAVSLANPLPYSLEEKIKQVPGVVDVCKLQWIGAFYKDKRNFFANFAVDPDKMETVFDDYKIDPKQLADFKADRRGCIVGTELMERYGWKIGDHITLIKSIFPYNPELTIRATYTHPVNTSSLYYQMKYHEESAGVMGDGRIGTFWLKVKDASQMPVISQQIDAMFKNSDDPTETMTEKDFQAGFMAMMGNIKLLFTSISTCAIFMVILLAAITMSMSARERVTEIAVLKAIGFGQRLVLTLMLTEFVLLTVVGGVIGVVLGKVVYASLSMGKLTGGMLVDFTIYPVPAVVCIAASLGVGLLAGGFPARNATRLSVVDGLRRVV